MTDNNYKTTFTTEEVEEKKLIYIENKKVLISYLKEISDLIEDAGDNPLSGELRKMVMDKFSMVDHRLLDRFDASSFEYFEVKEAVEK